MEYKLEKDNKNNKKKLTILIPIIFCMIILIVGSTTAFFSQGGSDTLDDVASENVTLKYTDNTIYMKNNLIPVVEEDVEKFASKNNYFDSSKYTDNDICKYTDEYNACSLYEFTIENTANISQALYVSMIPTLNEYNNFYFMLYEGEANKLTPDLKPIEEKTKIEQDTVNFDNLILMLNPGQSKTYTLVFYVKSLDEAQDDMNKRFAAAISVNSITTGYNEVVQVGKGCYDFVKLRDGTLKLTKFNGIDHSTGDITTTCGVTKDDSNYYSVTVPSTYAGLSVSTLGNSVFLPMKLEEFTPNDITTLLSSRHFYIKELTIEEGITTIEDGVLLSDVPQFGDVRMGLLTYAGFNVLNKQPLNDDGVVINLPNSLKYIGDYAFEIALVKTIDLPNNLEYIGNRAFANNPFITEVEIPASVQQINLAAFGWNNLEKVTFEDTPENPSQLKTIEKAAFASSNITTLTIPSSVQVIGGEDEDVEVGAFSNNENLTELIFDGAEDGTSQLKTIGAAAFRNINISSVTIPKSVETIDIAAFTSNENLTELIFSGAEDGTSQLKTIGEGAFAEANLSSLKIPSNVETIGESSFMSNDITSIEIPSSVQTIGEKAFFANYLTRVTFKLDEKGNSKLTTIGKWAFNGNVESNGGVITGPNDLTYPKGNPLFIPSSVVYIGDEAFSSNSNLKEIKFSGTLTYSGSNWYGTAEIIP